MPKVREQRFIPMTASQSSSTGVPSAKPKPRSHVSVDAVIRPIDLRAAVTAAGLDCLAPQMVLRTLASDLNFTITSVLASRGGPRIADTRATGDDLAAIATSLRAILTRFSGHTRLQEGMAVAPPGRGDVAEWLRRLDLPVVDALRGAAAVDHADAWLAVPVPQLIDEADFDLVQTSLAARNPKKNPPRAISRP